jgi:hypothetical protein
MLPVAQFVARQVRLRGNPPSRRLPSRPLGMPVRRGTLLIAALACLLALLIVAGEATSSVL